jgi:hypothetical protein
MRASANLHRFATTLAVIGASSLASACGGSDDGALATDSALQRDLTLAASLDSTLLEFRDTVAPAPRRSRAAATPSASGTRAPARRPTPPPARQPRRTAPAVAPVVSLPEPTTVAPAPAPAPATRAMIAAGTSMSLAIGSRVCTSNRSGDKFVATLSESVTGTNGAVIPAGTRAVVEVASVTPATDGNDARITFRVRTISTDDGPLSPVGEAVPEDALEKVRVEGGSDAKKVAAGAVVGALIGQMIGKDTKGTVIGAATGAAAGTIAARAGAKYDGCLPAGGRVRMVLAEGLVVG